MREILYYDVKPVYKPTPEEEEKRKNMVFTAAMLQCMYSGEYLASMGGGGDALSVKVYDAINNRRYPHVKHSIVNTEKLDRLLELLKDNPPSQEIHDLIYDLAPAE